MNSLEFDGEHYFQTTGNAIATKVVPAFACMFMGFLEERIFQVYQVNIPLLYLKYIDDGFGILDVPEADVAKVLDFFG
jgi:hypothetical protein